MKTANEILKSGKKTSTGAEVFSVTGLPAETSATLHALNSREPGGFKTNIGKVLKSGKVVERVMDRFYIGYGHRSIGDCATADVYFDGVSMLAANAFEHWPLFNGQETSSRFVDVTTNGYHLPFEVGHGEDWCVEWLHFYNTNLPEVVRHIQGLNPFEPPEANECLPDKDWTEFRRIKETVWEKATKSRALDIMGAFLPCGAKTNFSEVVNLRQWADQLQVLVYHPLKEIAELAETALAQLGRDHPNSFRISEREEKAEYMTRVAGHLYGGINPEHATPLPPEGNDFMYRFDKGLDYGSFDINDGRPPACDLPFDLASAGWFKVHSYVDYRTFRDLHRQRSATWRMPVVRPKYGFEQWYLDQLPVPVREWAVDLILSFEHWYGGQNIGALPLQYATPMGYKVPVHVTIPFNAAVYIAELRTALSVHPTARRWASKLGKAIHEVTGVTDFRLHVCEDPDRFCLDRGNHDIVEKEGG